MEANDKAPRAAPGARRLTQWQLWLRRFSNDRTIS
jgi:hypothetical protein